MTHPSFSIIVPVYGVEKYIERCARSLFTQTYDRIEFMFVNDGTKDRSIEILNELIDREFAALRPLISIIDKENAGLPAARRTGLEHAGGDYILHVDSDDYLEKDAVSHIAAAAESSDADLIYFDLVKEYPDRISYKRERDYSSTETVRFAINILNGKSMGWLVTKCFRRSLYQDVHFAPCGVYEDIYSSLQLLCHSQSVYHLKEYLYHYDRSNPQAYTALQKRNRHEQFCRNMLDLYDRYSGSAATIGDVFPSMMFRVGWYTVLHGFGFFESHPELREYLRTAPLGRNYYIPVPAQLYVRFKAKRSSRK